MNDSHLISALKRKIIIGVDEVGRGSWAGPLVVGAVILDVGAPIPGLKDSKQIPKQLRPLLAEQVRLLALAYSLGWVWPAEIDELGLTAATTLAIERSIENMPHHHHIVIDGSINYLPANPKAISLVKADNLLPAASAASIIAKVARDSYMIEQSAIYPEYGFEMHVGYGTGRHIKALAAYGSTPLHRMSFRPVQKLQSTPR